METQLQNPLILGRFQNNTVLPLKVTIQSDKEILLNPGEMSCSMPIMLSGLMALEMKIADEGNNGISDPILIWKATLTKVPTIYQQSHRYAEWVAVPIRVDGISLYHFVLQKDGESLVIIGTVELVEEDALREKAHA